MTPVDVCCDRAGVLYVADGSTDRILKLAEDGNVLSQFGGFGDGKGRLNGPVGLATDGFGHIYVVESGNRRIQKFDLAGSSAGIFAENLQSPEGIALSPGGVVYLTDSEKDKVVVYDGDGELLSEMGEYGWGEGFFDAPSDVESDALGNLFVVDRGNKRVQVFDKDGQFRSSFGPKVLRRPEGIAIDQTGRAFVTDSDAREVFVFSSEGKLLGASSGSGLKSPAGVCTYGHRVFVADPERHRIAVFDVPEEKNESQP